jgi:electron transfer flavoprotein beta subunit
MLSAEGNKVKIVVCIRQVPDLGSVDVDPVTGAIDEERLIYVVNPADECAVEEAVRIKERVGGGEVVVITLGPPQAEEALRQCLALGADQAVRIWDRGLETISALATARILARAIESREYDLVLCGARSADWGSGQVGPAIAEILGLPQVCHITKLKLSPQQQVATVQRKLERGEREVVECPLPALFTVDPALNEPRYPSLPCYMEALTTDVTHIDLRDLGMMPTWLGEESAPRVLQLLPPRPRPKTVFTPDGGLPAYQRIEAILQGMVSERKGVLIEGSPEELADKMMQFLVQRGMIGSG